VSEWSSRPRQLPPTGRRKGTARFCTLCMAWHSLFPPDPCPAADPKPEPGSMPIPSLIRVTGRGNQPRVNR
jgi:hypothetical protein